MENRKDSSTPFLIFAALLMGIGIGLFISNTPRAAESTDKTYTNALYNEKYIEEITSLLRSKYIGEFTDPKKLTYEIANAVTNSLGNIYTVYLNPDEAEEYVSARNPDFEGIGVSIIYNGTNTEIEGVLKDHPAYKAGIKPKDEILEIDNKDYSGKKPDEVVNVLRGEAGSTLDLKIKREQEILSFKIIREKIELDNFSYEVKDGVLIITITQFLDESVEKFIEAWDKMIKEININNPDLKGVIVDLRNNPGGYVYAVRYVLEEFLKNGQIIMKERGKDKSEIIYKDERPGYLENIELNVLVNEGSASASEIFAAAVQDNKRGKVFGQKTLGKGVEQEEITLSDGGKLIIVFQEWLTPLGRVISKENPITPDEVIENIEGGGDEQLEKVLTDIIN